MFVILIGSVARGDYSINSDIDICRIDSNFEISKKTNWPLGPINYIDYTYEDFMHLYLEGSLFIYHILHEGILVHGNKCEWERFRKKFVFVDNLDEEINNIKEIIFEFIDVNIFGNTFLSLYSNLFTLVKNYSIFSLSQEGKFIFNKEHAIKLKFGDRYYELLNAAHNRFERGIVKEELKWDYTSPKLAIQVIDYYKENMGEGYAN